MYKEGTGRVRIQINKYDGLRVRHRTYILKYKFSVRLIYMKTYVKLCMVKENIIDCNDAEMQFTLFNLPVININDEKHTAKDIMLKTNTY